MYQGYFLLAVATMFRSPSYRIRTLNDGTSLRMVYAKTYNAYLLFSAPLLSNLDISQRVPWIELLEALRSCPLLTRLSVVAAAGSASSAKPHTVYLPHLEKLESESLQSPDHDMTFRFLDHLQIPQSVDCYMSFSSTDRPSHILYAALTRPQFEHAARDTLSITAWKEGEEEEEDRDIGLNISLSESHSRPFSEYRTHPQGDYSFRWRRHTSGKTTSNLQVYSRT